MLLQVFPFALVSQVAFRFLPPEVLSMIFRYLDDDSLLNVFSTGHQWAEVCRGDPILRWRLKNRVLQIQKEKRRILLNPSAGVKINRPEQSIFFGKNQPAKQVVVNRIFLPEVPSRLPKITRNSSVVSKRRGQNVRKDPYQKLRI